MTVVVYVVGFLAAVSAAGVILAGRTIYSALSLVISMVSLAVLFLLLNAQFLAAVQIIIYAGAIMVLFVFIIALLSPGAGTDDDESYRTDRRSLFGLLAVAAVTALVFYAATNDITYNTDSGELRGHAVALQANPGDRSFQYSVDAVNGDQTHPGKGNVQTTGEVLFTRFLLPFEITSLLLLVAAIGAVYLTRSPRHRSVGR